MYMYVVHDYRYGLTHRESTHVCRVGGQRLWKSKVKPRSYECNALIADLKIAFDNTSGG